MKSQLLEHPADDFPNPFPDPKPLAGLFGGAPVEPGFYGQEWGSTILVTTNHRPTLAKIGQSTALSLTVLALDAGGFSLEAATALDAVSSVQVDKALMDLEKQTSTQNGRILAPHILAAKFGWGDGTRIGIWTVCVVPGDLTKLPAFLQSNLGSAAYTEKHLPAVLRRLMTGLTLMGGQALILAIPLLVFGWQALVKGLAALAFSTLVLALAWKILPGRGWLKGLVAGSILALALALILILVIKGSIYPVFGLFLSCFWMSLVFCGAKH